MSHFYSSTSPMHERCNNMMNSPNQYPSSHQQVTHIYSKSISKEHKANPVLQNSIEIIQGKICRDEQSLDKLYWYCNKLPPKNIADSFFFNIDEVCSYPLLRYDVQILIYNGYNKDFGPLNLSQTHRFCSELGRILKDEKY